MTPDEFLADHPDPRPWSLTDGELDLAAEAAAGDVIKPDLLFLGQGEHALEVATARVATRPRITDVRSLWRRRHRGRPSPLLLIVAYPREGSWRAHVCGPVGEEPPVAADAEFSQVERLCAAALVEPNRHTAVRLLAAALPEVESDLPGVRNAGMFATHELSVGVPERSDWSNAGETGRKLLRHRGRRLVEALGYEIEDHATTASVLRAGVAKRAIAVFLQEQEGFEDATERFTGTSPVTHALALADSEALPWVVLTRGSQIRIYSARPDVGVGRKGRAETFIELNLALLSESQAGYLPLIAGAQALLAGGSFEQILGTSGDYAAALGARLRDRLYAEAVPTLAEAIARQHPGEAAEEQLDALYEQALVALFRLLFVAYAEDKDLLPYRTNGRYQQHALKTMARHLTDRRAEGTGEFDRHATDLWHDVRALWEAVDQGNSDWGVPAYDGGLFSDDPDINEAGAALGTIELSNADLGPSLDALLVDVGPDGVIGPVDFRSLSVREFGTIYEGLLESNLSVAPTDLTLERDGTYVPAGGDDEIVVAKGDVYFHNRSGARKSTGSYFTKPFAVEHLLDSALEPALDDHLATLEQRLDAGDEFAAAEAFFDFRCADLAMGSGHFLVAAVDRIEARLSAFLALHPIPTLTADLDRLKAAALDRLGTLADGVEIEQTSLLRRQVARRCVYGVDRNRVAVELARLGMWIHTFVPGLPLSFLDHSLVWGDSLTGIGTIQEALDALEPDRGDGQMSVFEEQIKTFVGRANDHLRRLARVTEATVDDVHAAREAHEQALGAVEPARRLFDLIVAARLGDAAMPVEITEAAIADHEDLDASEEWRDHLGSLHFPIAFPEVFLRERPGFDCIIGNPPWEEATVEKLGFWALRFPGLKSLPQGRQRVEVARLEHERPDLVEEYQERVAETEQVRLLLLAGPYPGMGSGDPDLYKAFCWRFWHLVRDGGAIGVVLPRSALSAAGSTSWREAILDGGAFADATMLLNTGGWVFDDAEHRYTIGLVAIRKGASYLGTVRTQGPYSSLARYEAARQEKPAEFSANEFRSWTVTASFPLLPSAEAAAVFAKLRAHPRLDGDAVGAGGGG